MNRTVTLSTGDTCVIDTQARTITTAPGRASLITEVAENLLLTDALIGPQVDDLAGIRGSWDDERAPVIALVQACRMVGGVSVVNVEG